MHEVHVGCRNPLAAHEKSALPEWVDARENCGLAEDLNREREPLLPN